MATKRREYHNQLPDGGYVAAGKGQCAQCLQVVEVGDTFYWRSGAPAAVQCAQCRNRRLGKESDGG